MTEDLKQRMEQELPEALEKAKKYPAFKDLPCKVKIVDGKLEFECASKEASQELADGLEQEVLIRVKPGKVTEAADEPGA